MSLLPFAMTGRAISSAADGAAAKSAVGVASTAGGRINVLQSRGQHYEPGVRPRILVLGWTGCRHRHLRRYAEAYSELGFDTVLRTEHCHPTVLWRPSVLREKASDIAGLLEAEDGIPPFQAVHVFSNGGGAPWSAALRLIREQRGRGPGGKPIVVPTSQVVDSAPGYLYDAWRSFASSYHFLCEMIGTPLALAVYPVTVVPRLVWYAMTLQWTTRFSADHRWKDAWASDAAKLGVRRHLLLYSEDDLLVQAESVRSFSKMLRCRYDALQTTAKCRPKLTGDEICDEFVVREKIWKASKHVQHMRFHPDEYKCELRDFLSPRLSST